MEFAAGARKVHFSREFQLALDCCAFSFKDGSTAKPAGFSDVDWPRFIQLIRFHRIEGIACNALSKHADRLPGTVRDALSHAARAVAANNLQAGLASQQVLDCFEAACVPLLFLKGLTLGSLAYGNPALKAGIDIDLLIDPADLGKAAKLLRRCGYGLSIPRASAGDRILHAWHRSWKESVWTKRTPALQIDLHTRVADNWRLLRGIDVHAPRRFIGVGSDIHLPTLAPNELFAYLAVHGASSAWFRLKWIADFAALLAGEDAARIEELYRCSQDLGAGRAAGQALLLAHRLFGTLAQNPALEQRLRQDRATDRLYKAALELVGGEPNEPTERRLGTLTIHWTQFLLLPGARYKLSELLRQANGPLLRARS